MTVPLILVAAALLVLGLLLRAARGHNVAIRGLDDLQGCTQPVDIEAFRNLMDPAEEKFLRTRLPAKDFRYVQRRRIAAAIEYVGCAAHNAAVLLRLGEAMRRQASPEVAAAGNELVNSALRLRIYALFVLARLYAALLLPAPLFSPAHIVERYQHLTGIAARLFRLQRPAGAGRVSASL